jgi:hypothetical protein
LLTTENALGIARSYDDLHRIMRARADELEVSRLVLDETAGITSGHSSKLLAPRPMRRLGAVTMPAMLGALGLALVVVEDPEALARISRLPKRRSTNVRHRDASEPMLPTKNSKGPPHPRRGSVWAQQMNARRSASLSRRKRSEIARQAARARWA